MTLKDRFRRLRKSSPTSSTTESPKLASKPAQRPAPKPSSPTNLSPSTQSTNVSTPGQETPAATQTPTAAISASDLPSSLSQSSPNDSTSPLTNASTIQEVLVARAATTASQTTGEKKKRRGLFRRKEDPYKDWPEDVYKPHEVPAPKYKRTPDPKHLENLHAFSFGGTAGGFGGLMRRLSQQSGVSPGGSKWQSPFASRAGSRVGSRAPSRLASAAPSANPSRNASVVDEVEEDGTHVKPNGIGSPSKHSRPGTGGRGVSTKNLSRGLTMQPHDVDRVTEEEGEGDIGNVGMMSRPRTAKDEEAPADDSGTAETASKSSHDMPFTEQELTQALTRATLRENGTPKIVATPPS